MREAERSVDRYLMHEAIAAGGMATVYFARQSGAAGFSKAVAIKRMRPDLLGEREFVELFLDEARLAARVRHANVVSVIDVVDSGKELLIVMEYIHGESLARLLQSAERLAIRVPLDIAVAIIVGVLQGLHAAHEAKDDEGVALGIVHRDVSPQNVIVGADGTARVLDFGIARAQGQLHATDDGKTRGKARYAAPEQLRGADISRRADLFAASALLWEMVTGKPLFGAETQTGVINAVLTEPITAPGVLVPELSTELDELIMRGLDRDPKKRHATAAELARALERAQPPASSGAVAEWVASLAGPALDAREIVIRRIESGRETNVVGAPAAEAVVAATDLATEEVATRPLSKAKPPAGRSLVLPAIVVATVALGVAIMATLNVVRRSPAGQAAAETSAPLGQTPMPKGVSPTAVPLAPPAMPPQATPIASAATTAPPDIELVPDAPVAASAPASKPKGSIRRPPPSVPTAPKSKRCDTPYDLDSSGRKIFRVDCL